MASGTLSRVLRFADVTVIEGCGAIIAALAAISCALSAPLPTNANSPRSVISFNADWRFAHGDPAGVGDSLSYAKLKPAMLAPGKHKAGAPPFARPGFDDSQWP